MAMTRRFPTKEETKEMREKAEAGDVQAMFYLGTYDALRKGKSRSFKWLEKAAEAGLIPAMFMLGTMHTRLAENPTPEELSEGIRWYEKGAEAGNAECMRMLAYFYSEGEYVEKDPERAAEWLAKAREIDPEGEEQ